MCTYIQILDNLEQRAFPLGIWFSREIPELVIV